MSSIKDIQRRKQGIVNTQKITKAMEMVAATKMKRAVNSVLKSRRYANLGWMTVSNIAKSLNGNEGEPIHPFLVPIKEKPKNIEIILINTNRGLCGSFNFNIINKMHKTILNLKKKFGQDINIGLNILGKKGYIADKYFGYKIKREFPKEDIVTDYDNVISVAWMAMDNFLKGESDLVYVAYTDYISSSKQKPVMKRVLPITTLERDENLGQIESSFNINGETDIVSVNGNGLYDTEYLFEPSPKEVLNEVLPRLIETQIYQALLESNASEHSVRMATMHQATDAAGEMIEELSLTYNKARQFGITNEILEISAGVDALAQV
jgi:F-type H+-transporting ATPase subunit gamma